MIRLELASPSPAPCRSKSGMPCKSGHSAASVKSGARSVLHERKGLLHIASNLAHCRDVVQSCCNAPRPVQQQQKLNYMLNSVIS